MQRVPADVTATKERFAGLAVVCENPLFTVRVLEVADVRVSIVTDNDWRIATPDGVVVANSQ